MFYDFAVHIWYAVLWSRHLSHALTCPAFLSSLGTFHYFCGGHRIRPMGETVSLLIIDRPFGSNGRTPEDNWGQPRSLCFPLEWNISSQELQTGLHPRDTYSVNLLLFSPNKELLHFICVFCASTSDFCASSHFHLTLYHLILLILLSSTSLAPPFPSISDTISTCSFSFAFLPESQMD